MHPSCYLVKTTDGENANSNHPDRSIAFIAIACYKNTNNFVVLYTITA